MAGKNQRKKKTRVGRILPGVLTMAAIVAAVVLCVAIFFKVGTVAVTGNERYSADEIAAASGIAVGDNMLMVNRSAASGQVLAKLPYVTKVQVTRTLPNKVTIAVEECAAAGVVTDESGAGWLIAPDGRILEMAGEDAAVPVLTGITAVSPQPGEKLVPGEEDAATCDMVASVLTALAKSPAADKIVSVDFEKIYSIRMMYGEKYEIDLGGTDELAYKFEYLEQILTELAAREPDASGQIDLTLQTEKVARFLPW